MILAILAKTGLTIHTHCATQCSCSSRPKEPLKAPQHISSYTKTFLPLYLMTRMVESPSPNLVMGVSRTSYASGLISSVRL